MESLNANLAAPEKLAELQSLRDEEIGVAHRIEHYYLPLFREFCRASGKKPSEIKILDCGCGNGLSVQLLSAAGFNAFGVDYAELRIQQWKAGKLNSTVQGDATRLPFANESFDIVFSCGLLEHIGVAEKCDPDYQVVPLPEQTQIRRNFVGESMRVLRPGGVLYIDHPNGAFFVDFWHNDYRSRPRFHRPYEKFLPTFGEVKSLVRAAHPNSTVEAISPANRFTYRRSQRR